MPDSSDQETMRNLHGGFKDVMNALMLMALTGDAD